MRQLPEKVKDNSEAKAITAFGEYLYLAIYTLADLDITSRVFNYWKKHKVLPWFPSDKTAKFNSIEMLWLLMLNDLRVLGLSIEALKQIVDEIFLKPYREDYAVEFLNKEIEQRGIDEVSASLKNQMQYKGFLENAKMEINPFSLLVRRFIQNRVEAGIKIIFENNSLPIENESDEKAKYHHKQDFNYRVQYYEVKSEQQEEIRGIEIIDGSDETNEHAFIHLPLKKYMRKLYSLNDVKFTNAIPMFSDQEKAIIQEIRKGRVDEIIITFEEGKIKRTTTMQRATLEAGEFENFIISPKWNTVNDIVVKKRSRGKLYVETYKHI